MTRVDLKISRKLRYGERSFYLADEVLDEIRLRMYGTAPRELAEDLGVSTSCVYSIKSGRTKWPRPATLFALLKYYDLELRLYDIKAQRYV